MSLIVSHVMIQLLSSGAWKQAQRAIVWPSSRRHMGL